MKKKRMTLALSAEASDQLSSMASERKRGELISQLIMQHAKHGDVMARLDRLEYLFGRLFQQLSNSSR